MHVCQRSIFTTPTAQSRLSNRKTGAEEAGMTEEEQIALQQQMFAAAAAQANIEGDPS